MAHATKTMLRPLHDHILGKVTDEGKKSPSTVREGDRILFVKHSGNEIKLNGEEHLIMTEEDVLGILTSEPAA